MAQLVVRNLEEDVKLRLQKRAKLHGHSMEEEARDIIRVAVLAEPGQDEGFVDRVRKRFEGIGLEEPIHEVRGYDAKPAKFGK